MLLLAVCLVIHASAQMPTADEFARRSSDDRVSYLFVEVFIPLKPDLAIKELDSLQHIAAMLKDDRMLAYSKILKAAVSCVGKTYPGQQKQILDSCAPVAEQSAFDDVKGCYYFYRGTIAFRNKDFTIAPPFLTLARRLLENAGYQSYPYAYIYDDGFFSMYYYFEDYQTAADYCQAAITNLGRKRYKILQYYYDNLGESYVKLKKYAEAKIAFEQGIEATEKAGDLNFKALIIGNLGNLLRLQGKYEEALPSLYINVSTNDKAIPENAAISRLYISNSLLQLDSVQKAKQYLTPPDFKMPYWTFPGYDIIRFETWALYYHKIHNYKLKSQYQDSLISLEDSVKIIFDHKKLSAMESNLQAQKYLDDKKELGIKAANEKFIRNLIIAGLMFLFAVLFFWLNNRRKAGIALEKQKLTQANIQLEQYIKNIQDKNDLIEKLSAELHQTDNSAASAETTAHLANLLNSVILTEDDWQEFKNLFERAFPGFFQTLALQYPGLTPAEERLLALEELHLPARDMAKMLGISADSIKKSRYRLRKKYPDVAIIGNTDDAVS